MKITVENATQFGKKVPATVSLDQRDIQVALSKHLLAEHGLVVKPEQITFHYGRDNYDEIVVDGVEAPIEVEVRQAGK
jgi:hypothetical protein